MRVLTHSFALLMYSTPIRSFVKQAAIDAITANHNQYTRPGGQVDYVNVLAKMYSPLLARELNPMTNIVTFNGAQEGIAAIMAALLEPVRPLRQLSYPAPVLGRLRPRAH